MARNLAVQLLVTAFLLSCAAARAASVEESFANLQSDEERVRFLLGVRNEIPSLFEKSTTYKFSMLDLLYEQRRLLGQLTQLPEFQQRMAARENLSEITIAPKTTIRTSSIQVRPDALAAWRTELLSTFDAIALNPGGKTVPALRKTIQDLLSDANGQTADQLIVALSQLVPDETKRTIFKAPTLEEKLLLLQQHLPQKLEGFRNGHRFGLSPESTATEAIARVQKLYVTNERLQQASTLDAAIQALNVDEQHIDPAQMRQRIAEIDAKELRLLSDHDGLSPYLEKLRQDLGKVGDRLKVKEVSSRIRSNLSRFSSQTEEVAEELGKPIHLKEVPPGVGIFRGCAGGDCSSSLSFPYPNDPNERIYFIYGNSGELKGYLEGTIVEAGGKKSFYLSCINGPKLSSGETRMIIQGLHSGMKDLQVEQIILPESKRIDSLINYESISPVFHEYSQKGVRVPIQYLQSDVRAKIEAFGSGFHTGTYDHMSSNTHGTVLEIPPSAQMPLHLSYDRRAPLNLLPELNRRDLAALALDLHYLDQPGALNVVGRVGRIDRDEFLNLVNAIQNPEGLPVSAFEANLESKLTAFGLSKQDMAKREYLLWEGYLRAKDAFSGEHMKSSLTYLLKAYERKPTRELLAMMAKHPEEVKQDPAFARIRSSLFGRGQLGLEQVKEMDRTLKISLGKQDLLQLVEAMKNSNATIWKSAQKMILSSPLRDPEVLKALVEASSDLRIANRDKFIKVIGEQYREDPVGLASLVKSYYSPFVNESFQAEMDLAGSPLARAIQAHPYEEFKSMDPKQREKVMSEISESISKVLPGKGNPADLHEILRSCAHRFSELNGAAP